MSWKTSYSFNDFKWRKMALSCPKKLSALIRGITSKHFYCLNCFHSFAKEKKLESHKKVCENKEFCNVIMPAGDAKILEFNQYKAPFVIYADLQCIIEKIDVKIILNIHLKQT